MFLNQINILAFDAGSSFTLVSSVSGRGSVIVDPATSDVNNSSVAIIIQSSLHALISAAQREFGSTRVDMNLLQLSLDVVEVGSDRTRHFSYFLVSLDIN